MGVARDVGFTFLMLCIVGFLSYLGGRQAGQIEQVQAQYERDRHRSARVTELVIQLPPVDDLYQAIEPPCIDPADLAPVPRPELPPLVVIEPGKGT